MESLDEDVHDQPCRDSNDVMKVMKLNVIMKDCLELRMVGDR
jgi:hypothetical protein